MIRSIAFTGTAVTDMQRARAFYEGVLGLKVSEELAGGKWVEYDLGGSVFALTNINPKWTPSEQGTAIAFEVDDVGEMVNAARASGAPVYMEESETPVCWMGIVHDPDGNKVVFHKLKESHA